VEKLFHIKLYSGKDLKNPTPKFDRMVITIEVKDMRNMKVDELQAIFDGVQI